MTDELIISNFQTFGFYKESDNFLTYKDFVIDNENYLLITKNCIFRYKNLQDLWNNFLVIY